jgi:hypothetical protein
VKFDVGNLYENMSTKSNFGYNQAKISDTLLEDPTYILLLPAILRRHKGALFEWNGIRLLGQPRRYKNYANAPQQYVIHFLSSLPLSDVWPAPASTNRTT